MTSDQQRQFEHVWPALAVRLQRMLRRKKVAPWLQEDVVQETGLRLIRMWEHIDQTKPLWPLTATIGLNLLRDEMRKATWSELVQAVPETASGENVERRGLARLELRAVGRSLKRMPESHRHILLAEMSDEPAPAPDPSATRMLRMRARRKLQHLMDQASMLGIALGAQLRRLAREAELLLGRALPERAEGLATAAVGLLAALSMGIVMTPDAPAIGGSVDLPASERGVVSSTKGDADNGDVGAATRARGDAAADEGASSSSSGRARGTATETQGGGSSSEEGTGSFPGRRTYRVAVTEDTYVEGEIEVEVVGGSDITRTGRGEPPKPGSVDCTVAPGHVGASCTHTGEESRGVRAEHSGQAYVGGKRVY